MASPDTAKLQEAREAAEQRVSRGYAIYPAAAPPYFANRRAVKAALRDLKRRRREYHLAMRRANS